MSGFGKKTTKRIGVSPKVSSMVKKAEATSFDKWCKRKGMTTKKGKATKACIKKAISKSKTTKKSGFGARRTRAQQARELYLEGRREYLSAKRKYGQIIIEKPTTTRGRKFLEVDKALKASKTKLKKAAFLSPIKYGTKVAKLLISRGRWKFGFDPRKKMPRRQINSFGSTESLLVSIMKATLVDMYELHLLERLKKIIAMYKSMVKPDIKKVVSKIKDETKKVKGKITASTKKVVSNIESKLKQGDPKKVISAVSNIVSKRDKVVKAKLGKFMADTKKSLPSNIDSVIDSKKAKAVAKKSITKIGSKGKSAAKKLKSKLKF